MGDNPFARLFYNLTHYKMSSRVKARYIAAAAAVLLALTVGIISCAQDDSPASDSITQSDFY